jgi:hypothetical protein
MDIQAQLSSTQDSLLSFLLRLTNSLDMLSTGITDDVGHEQLKLEVQEMVETLKRVRADLHSAIDSIASK